MCPIYLWAMKPSFTRQWHHHARHARTLPTGNRQKVSLLILYPVLDDPRSHVVVLTWSGVGQVVVVSLLQNSLRPPGSNHVRYLSPLPTDIEVRPVLCIHDNKLARSTHFTSSTSHWCSWIPCINRQLRHAVHGQRRIRRWTSRF